MTVSFKSGNQQRLFQAVVAQLARLGYVGDRFAQDYAFRDWFISGTPQRVIKAAAFAQAPVSYETALFGVALANGTVGKRLVAEHRALGAPIVFEIGEDAVSRWTVGIDDETTVLRDRFGLENIGAYFEARDAEWSPSQFFRLKTTGEERRSYQLELFAGLIPELEEQIREKLDPRLRVAVSSVESAYREDTGQPAEERQIFQLIFRLLTGKVFRDRNHPRFRDLSESDGPDAVLACVNRHYAEPERFPLTMPARQAAFQHIWSALDFSNLSPEVLSQIWSSTLVSPVTRKRLGIYRTRKSIVRYIVERIPFDTFDKDECTVLEPCSGSATFLIMAMERLKELRTDLSNPAEQHAYFQRMLMGFEQDPFGHEISHLCLSLADYPNHDGWRLEHDNVFTSRSFPIALSKARVVLCNPPFKRFSRSERDANHAKYWEPPAELLTRVLAHQHPDGVLGFVLPRTFINGEFYRDTREQLVRRFRNIEIVQLADKGWEHADPETALLIATEPRPGDASTVSFSVVRERDWQDFDWYHKIASQAQDHKTATQARSSLAIPELRDIWEFLSYCPKLGERAQGRHALRWKLSLKENLATLVRDTPAKDFQLGIRPPTDSLYSFIRPATAFLSFAQKHRKKRAFGLPWDEPKVFVNKIAKERGPWRFAAFADFRGLACSESLYPVWPNDPADTVALAAVLNGPVANAFSAIHSGKRETTLKTLHAIPYPILSPAQIAEIERLAQGYVAACSKRDFDIADTLIRRIDAEILDAYGLPPRMQRRLLDFFNGFKRHVPFRFDDYYPKDFEPYFTLSEWLTGRPAQATIERFRSQSRELPDHILAALAVHDEEGSCD